MQGMIAGGLERMSMARSILAEEGGRLAREITVHRTEYPARNLSIVDLLPAGCSKGAALKRLAYARGIAREDVMAIGDNWNDFEMLDWAGQAVIMRNAPEDLHEAASARGWYVTASNEDDGVGLAVERALGSVVELT
jgi:hydroxymethylpyrimidine pyrophosphatase-like HAD family hydrolase